MREQHPKPRQLRNRATPSAAGDRPTETSDWNPTQHTLRWQGHVVKRFKAQAPYQKALVDEFAAQGWSPSEHLQPVQVVTADGRALSFLSRGLSSSSIRLIGTCRLLGVSGLAEHRTRCVSGERDRQRAARHHFGKVEELLS